MKATALLLMLSGSVSQAGSSGTELGVGGGVTVAPTFLSGSPVLIGALGSFEIGVPLGERLSLRISPMLGGGVAPSSRGARLGGGVRLPGSGPLGFVGLFLDGTLRLHFTDSVQGGIGWTVGLPSTLDFVFGPSLTPLSIRLDRVHELSVWVSLPLVVFDGNLQVYALLPTIRYAYFF